MSFQFFLLELIVVSPNVQPNNLQTYDKLGSGFSLGINEDVMLQTNKLSVYSSKLSKEEFTSAYILCLCKHRGSLQLNCILGCLCRACLRFVSPF